MDQRASPRSACLQYRLPVALALILSNQAERFILPRLDHLALKEGVASELWPGN